MSAAATVVRAGRAMSGSEGSRRRRGRGRGGRRPPAGTDRRQQGIALVLAITVVAILSVLLAEMHESTGTALVVSTTQRDRLRAEYLARSGLDLTRMLVGQEPAVRALVTPMYQMVAGRRPPQIPVWRFANEVLRPFCHAEETMEGGGVFDMTRAEGLDGIEGTCEIVASSENSKINLNDPIAREGDAARQNLAVQLFTLMQGYQSPNVYDALFNSRDADGLLTSRLDVVAAVADWWDTDSQRTAFDPATNTASSSGSEDDVYQRFDDPYHIKNAPFDSIEEVRLVRGISDDFWATFVEPREGDPEARQVTIYGIGSINPNEASPTVLLARLCTYIPDQSLCADPTEAMKFTQILTTARQMIPVPFFSRGSDFVNFVEGRGGSRDLYPMLQSFLGADNPLLFTPVSLPTAQRTEIARAFVTSASLISIRSTGNVGRAEVNISAVVNFDPRWTPPPPNAGSMTALGVLQYYRVQ